MAVRRHVTALADRTAWVGSGATTSERHGVVSWQFLFIGTVAAVGAALALGTAAALVRYHRTGSFPGRDPDDAVTTGQLAGLWARVLIGVVIAAGGLAWLADAGLL